MGACAQQFAASLALGDAGVLVGPSPYPQSVDSLHFPALSYESFPASFSEAQSAQVLAEILDSVLRDDDVAYTHMTSAGLAAALISHPHQVYMSHATQLQIGAHIPGVVTREKVPDWFIPALTAEYQILRHIVSQSGIVVTATDWEAQEICKLYADVDPLGHPSVAAISEGWRLPTTQLNLSYFRKVPLGINAALFCPSERERRRESHRPQQIHRHNMPENAIIIGTLGRVDPQKDVLKTVSVFNSLVESAAPSIRDRLFLLIAGPFSVDTAGNPSGYYKDVLTRVEQLGLTAKTRFTGAVNAADILSVFDYGISTSCYESCGLVRIEKGASGLPVVCSAIPAYVELNGGRDGPMFLSNSDTELADFLLGLIHNPNARAEYVARCVADCQEYTWQRSARVLYETVITPLLSRTR